MDSLGDVMYRVFQIVVGCAVIAGVLLGMASCGILDAIL